MVLKDKKTLYRLLNEYMNYLMELDDKNIENEKDRNKRGWMIENETIYGVKAQFNHARCITRRLGMDIEWELKA